MSGSISGVVVGIDGSASSIGAARWAGVVADKFGLPLHLVHSLVTTGQFISDAAVIAIRAAATVDQDAAAEKVLFAAEQAVRENNPTLAITTEAVCEPAHKLLVELSRQARLVIVGCDDVNPAAALLVGSTSLAVATHAASPAVVWRGVKAPNMRPVVVGVDGTSAGKAALAAGFEYANRFKVPLTAVHSWLTTVPPDGPTFPYLIDWEAITVAERALLDDAMAEWTQRYPNVEVQLVVEQDKPNRALMHHLADAQLVVVGNRRRNLVAAAVLGSTTLNLLHHSAVPVMVCHASDTEE